MPKTRDKPIDVLVYAEECGTLPIFLSDVKARHDKMVELVTRMVELHKKLPKATGAGKTTIERQIAATDKSIDAVMVTG